MDARRRELGLEDNDEYLVWRLHPNQVFSNECLKCSNPNSPGCPTAKGRNLYLLVLRLYIYDISYLFSLIFVEIVGNFAQRREAARLACEAAMKNIEPNLARPIERSSLIVVAAFSSLEDTNTVLSRSIPRRSPSASKSSDKSKGKDPPTPKSKRTHKGSKVVAPRKKTSQSSRSVSILESDETMNLVMQTPEPRRMIGESSQGLPSYP